MKRDGSVGHENTRGLRLATVAIAALAFWSGGCAQQSLSQVHEDAATARSPVLNLPAPDFTLPDQDNQPVTLSKLRGEWIVLYFYPKDDTPGCSCEATEFTSLLASFKQMNAKVYGLSVDSPATHRLFREHLKIGINLLSDADHKVMEDYGAWVHTRLGDKTYDRVIRTTLIIDPKGIIRYHWPEVIPQGHAERVKSKLALLQALAKKD
jgi:thioredoxin-dependent peroxiredoxin